MKSTKITAIVIAIFFVALWVVPFWRAINEMAYAQDFFSETSSMEAADEITYCFMRIFAYLVSLAGAFTVALVYARTGSLYFLIPLVILGYAGMETALTEREDMEAQFMQPWRPAMISIVAITITFMTLYIRRWRRLRALEQIERDAQDEGQPG